MWVMRSLLHTVNVRCCHIIRYVRCRPDYQLTKKTMRNSRQVLQKRVIPEQRNKIITAVKNKTAIQEMWLDRFLIRFQLILLPKWFGKFPTVASYTLSPDGPGTKPDESAGDKSGDDSLEPIQYKRVYSTESENEESNSSKSSFEWQHQLSWNDRE